MKPERCKHGLYPFNKHTKIKAEMGMNLNREKFAAFNSLAGGKPPATGKHEAG